MPSGPAARRAARRYRSSRTAATTGGRLFSAARVFLSASSVLTTSASASGRSCGRISTTPAVAGLVRGSTDGSVVGPLRQISRVRPVAPTLVLSASSIRVLFRSASTATADLRWLALAATSSPTTVKTCSDHPKDDRVAVFEHGGAATPQRGEPFRERRRDQADERRDVQQGDQCEQHRHHHPQRRARRTAQSQGLPGEAPYLRQPVRQRRRHFGIGPHQHRTGRYDDRQAQQRHPADESGGAAGQRAVEPVADSVTDRSAPLCHLPPSLAPRSRQGRGGPRGRGGRATVRGHES
ncbi:hypothetical protein STENM223S_03642 [Streptomyces tendae]